MNSEIQKKIFENHFKTFSEPIFRHCYFRTYDRNRAVELTQEVFMKTWDYIRDGKHIENMQAFLYKTANNLILNELTRKKKPESLEIMSEDQGFDPPSNEDIEAELDAQETKEDVLHKLKSIHPNYREVLYMKYIDGLSVKEISEILGESENNISVKIHRGLDKLKQIYKNYE